MVDNLTSPILVVKCTEKYLSIRSEFSMRHLAANISSPKVRELHDHFLWRERALLRIHLFFPWPNLLVHHQNTTLRPVNRIKTGSIYYWEFWVVNKASFLVGSMCDLWDVIYGIVWLTNKFKYLNSKLDSFPNIVKLLAGDKNRKN